MYKTFAAFLNKIFPSNFFYNFFFIYINVSKNSLAKYYQDDIERIQKSLNNIKKNIQVFLKKKN